jgi:hypothetical protein
MLARLTKAKYGSGGAMYVSTAASGSSLVINSTKFISNTARVGDDAVSDSVLSVCEGGAITINSGLSLNITSSEFVGNRCFSAGSPSVLNRAFGGALLYRLPALSDHGRKHPPSILIEGSTFSSNSIGIENGTVSLGTRVGGGAVAFEFNLDAWIRDIVIKDSEFIENTILQLNADATGAAVSISAASISLERVAFINSTFFGNHFKISTFVSDLGKNSAAGGAVSIGLMVTRAFPIEFNGCRFSHNSADTTTVYGSSHGGAISTIVGATHSDVQLPFYLINSYFYRNYARLLPAIGGALHLVGTVVPLIEGSTFVENSVLCYGGSDPANKRCDGGALTMFLTSTATIRNCTFTGNYIAQQMFSQCMRAAGGAVAVYGGQVIVSDCSFDNNTIEGTRQNSAHLFFPDRLTLIRCSWCRKRGRPLFVGRNHKCN